MPNMSYCRFENTLADLEDCLEHINDDVENLSKAEKRARKWLIECCKDIIDAVGDEEDDEQ